MHTEQPLCDCAQTAGRLNLKPGAREFTQHVSRLSFADKREGAFASLPSDCRNAFGACCPPNYSNRVIGKN